MSAIRIAERSIDAEQNHRLERYASGVDESAQLVCLEHAFAVLGSVLAHDALGRLLEFLAELNWLIYPSLTERVLENRADLLDFVAEPDGPVLLRQVSPK